MQMHHILTLSLQAAVILAISFAGIGCGLIADKDRIIIATLDGENITRGDLAEALRKMSDEDRPLVQNKADLFRALNKYIDDKIKSGLAERLVDEEKISAPRGAVEQTYFEAHPDQRHYYVLRNPSPEQLALIELSAGDLVAVQAEIGFGMDEVEERLLREEAFEYVVQERLRDGSLQITEEEYRAEFEARESTLKNFETIEIDAILFAAQNRSSMDEAREAVERLKSGEAFEDVSRSYENQRWSTSMRAVFRNDPENEKFRRFWEYATGSRKGDVKGPLFLEPFEKVEDIGRGRTTRTQMPQSFIVFKVVERAPETEMTFEEAKYVLEESIAVREVMQALRDEHGVQVFEDELPDPAGFGDQYKDLVIRTE